MNHEQRIIISSNLISRCRVYPSVCLRMVCANRYEQIDKKSALQLIAFDAVCTISFDDCSIDMSSPQKVKTGSGAALMQVFWHRTHHHGARCFHMESREWIETRTHYRL